MTDSSVRRYRFLLLLVSGLGGLLYGIDVGIIGGALPYLEATSGLTAGQLSAIVAAVLLGSVFSTLFAGALADWLGRRPLMILSGCTFVASIPIIAFSHGFVPLAMGRLLQGMSGGLIGVVVPLYLAECLPAHNRGKGAGVFQWLLTLGICAAALIGIYFSYRVAAVAKLGNASALFAFKDRAWRNIFWMSLPPGVLFALSAFFVSESPRWLFNKTLHQEALVALQRSRTDKDASKEFAEMERGFTGEFSAGTAAKESLMQRKYIVPFVLSCLILSLNQFTGVNSIIGYNTDILLRSGLTDLWAHWGYFLFTAINFLATIIGMLLVDKVGRKALLTFGTSGIIVSLVAVGALFARTEQNGVEVLAAIQSKTGPDGGMSFQFTPATALDLLQGSSSANSRIDPKHASLQMIYTCGDFTAATGTARSDDPVPTLLTVSQSSCLPMNAIESFFKNPFGNFKRSRTAPLHVEKALLGAIPTAANGWYIAVGLCFFMACFAIGPGVCVWLALSELMPTRIRSNGMSVALLLNQTVSTIIAVLFLPIVARFEYSKVFYLFAICTVGYLVTSVFFLPETKGKTLEEIEMYFDREPVQR